MRLQMSKLLHKKCILIAASSVLSFVQGLMLEWHEP
jgi:hypothetical protein